MEGSETTEVSIPMKPVTEVIITHKNHWNKENWLVMEFMSDSMLTISKFQFNVDRGPAWKPVRAAVASSLIIVICFHNKIIEQLGRGMFTAEPPKNLIHLAIYQ